MIIYDGPSKLNGERILGIVTGLNGASTNRKTGPMAQLYIISATEHPTVALKREGFTEILNKWWRKES